jgi:hypothetical protein
MANVKILSVKTKTSFKLSNTVGLFNFLSQGKHNSSPWQKVSLLKLFMKILTVYSENHTKSIATHSVQNAELLMLKHVVLVSYHYALKG